MLKMAKNMKIRYFLSNLDKGINLLVMVIGVVMISLYLNATRLGSIGFSVSMLFLGVSFCVASLVISYVLSTKEKTARFSLLSLYILTYSLLAIYSFRYYFFGSDLGGEYYIASEALDSNSWPISLLTVGWGPRGGRYASSLSVSVLPSLLSKVTGIPLLPLFKFVMPAIGAFVPIGIYLLVNEVYHDKRLALLSAMLFSMGHLQIYMLAYMFRRQVGHLLLVISLWAIFKFYRNKTSLSKFVIILLFSGIVLSNYLIADFAFLFFLGLTVTPLVTKLLRMKNLKNETVLSWKIFLSYCTIMIGWLWSTSNMIFWEHISTLETHYFLITTYGLPYLSKLIRGEFLPSYGEGTAVLKKGLTTSPILNIWYYLVVLLPSIGWLYALFKYKHNTKEVSLISCFFLAFAFFFFEAFYGTEGASTPFASCSIVFCVFLALAVHRSNGHLRHQKIFALFAVILICAGLPLNLSLPNNQVLHIYPEKQILPEMRVKQYDISFKDTVSSQWIENYVPLDESVTVDNRGFFSVLMIANHLRYDFQSRPRFVLRGRFFLGSYSFVFHGIWYTDVWGFSAGNVTFSQMAANSSVIYSNGETFLLRRELRL